jgi:hypothetical protein
MVFLYALVDIPELGVRPGMTVTVDGAENLAALRLKVRGQQAGDANEVFGEMVKPFAPVTHIRGDNMEEKL